MHQQHQMQDQQVPTRAFRQGASDTHQSPNQHQQESEEPHYRCRQGYPSWQQDHCSSPCETWPSSPLVHGHARALSPGIHAQDVRLGWWFSHLVPGIPDPQLARAGNRRQ